MKSRLNLREVKRAIAKMLKEAPQLYLYYDEKRCENMKISDVIHLANIVVITKAVVLVKHQ